MLPDNLFPSRTADTQPQAGDNGIGGTYPQKEKTARKAGADRP